LAHNFDFILMSDPTQSSSPSLWERGASRTIAKTKVFDLCGVSYRHPKRGTEREFVCLNAPDWVNVVAVTKEGKLVLVTQFRFGTNSLSLEVPGGVIEKGEDPVAAGLRELAEETGYSCTSATLLGSLHPNPAIMSNRCHVVLAEGVSPTHALGWDPDEELEVSLASVSDVLAWVAQGRITHSLSVCALMLYLQDKGGQPRV
jgi:8-oxo-dGTP pyrophosphatase MutT (NUDIX family)